jgi:hypothetical protein
LLGHAQHTAAHRDGFLGAARLRLDHLQLVVVLLADAVETGRGDLNRPLE